MRRKKAVLDNLGGIVTALGTIAILLAIIFLIIAETRTIVEDQDRCANSTHVYNATHEYCHVSGAATVQTGWSHSYNATTQVQSATSDIPGWLPIVVITLIGGVLLTLVRYFRST